MEKYTFIVPPRKNNDSFDISLTEKQAAIVNSSAKRMIIRGPPGTGKSVIVKILSLKAARDHLDQRSIVLLTHTRTLKKEYELFFEANLEEGQQKRIRVVAWLDANDLKEDEHLFCDEGDPDGGILRHILMHRSNSAVTVASMTCHKGIDEEEYAGYEYWTLLQVMRNPISIFEEWFKVWNMGKETQSSLRRENNEHVEDSLIGPRPSAENMPLEPFFQHNITGSIPEFKVFSDINELLNEICNILEFYQIFAERTTQTEEMTFESTSAEADTKKIKKHRANLPAMTSIIVVHEEDVKVISNFLQKNDIKCGSAVEQMIEQNCIAVEFWKETFSLEWALVIFVNFHHSSADITNESLVAMSRARSRLFILEMYCSQNNSM